MAVIGSLAVNIIAKMNPFAKGVDDARRKIGGLRGEVLKLNRTMRTMASVALGAVGIRGLGSLVSSSLESIDELSKLSQRTNIAVADLQVFGHAANLAGLDMQQLTKSLQTLGVMVAKANTGEKAAASVFARLGLDPQQLRDAGPQKALGMVADKLNAVQDAGERAREALALFGKAGGQMSVLLADGSAGLEKMREDFAKVGTAISDDDAKRIEAFNDSLTRLKTALGGAIQGLVIDIAPGAVEAINSLADTIVPGMKAFIDWQKRIGAEVGKRIAPTGDEPLSERLGGIPVRAMISSSQTVTPAETLLSMGVLNSLQFLADAMRFTARELVNNTRATDRNTDAAPMRQNFLTPAGY